MSIAKGARPQPALYIYPWYQPCPYAYFTPKMFVERPPVRRQAYMPLKPIEALTRLTPEENN